MTRECLAKAWLARFHARVALDLLWCAAFAASLSALLLASRGRTPIATDAGLELALAEGGQRQGLYRQGRRSGSVSWRVQRRAEGWSILNRIELGRQQAARVALELRRDLSLTAFSVEADVTALVRLSGLTTPLGAQLEEVSRVRVRGDCSRATDRCRLSGHLGAMPIDQHMVVGRGPVVTSAIYPLLASGTLGNQAEVTIFDPLTLARRVITFTVEGQEELRLADGRVRTIRVRRDLEQLASRVWIDRRGRALKEELPLGFVLVHEAWTER